MSTCIVSFYGRLTVQIVQIWVGGTPSWGWHSPSCFAPVPAVRPLRIALLCPVKRVSNSSQIRCLVTLLTCTHLRTSGRAQSSGS